MTRVNPWWTGDLGQAHAINDLDDELAAERRVRREQARRLEAARRELDSGFKRVDERLGTVTERIEAVLDWTEMRFQLGEFDEYQARKEVRKTVRALASGRPARMPDVADVPGFWLPPAAAAVLPLVLRDHPAIPAQRTAAHPFADLAAGLEAARERDAVRAELFNLAVGRCFDQPVLIDAAVLRLLTEPSDLGVAAPGLVAAGWRTLWEHTAFGAFGPGAAVQLEGILRERFDADALDEDELRAWDEAVEGFGAIDDRRLALPEAFAALEAHLADAGTASMDPEAVSAASLSTAAPWRVCLQELIEEPSPAELPLVREMEALGLDGEGPRYSRPSWAEPAGTLPALLRRDLFDPGAPAALRRLALDLTAPLLRSRLDRLESGLAAPEAVVRTVRRRGLAVEVTREGPDPEQVDAIARRIDLDFEPNGPSKPVITGSAVALGAIALLFLVFGQWFLAILFGLLVLVPLYIDRSGRTKAADAQARRDDQLARLRADLLQAREDVERREREAAELDTATRGALERLREALPADPDPTLHGLR